MYYKAREKKKQLIEKLSLLCSMSSYTRAKCMFEALRIIICSDDHCRCVKII